MLRGYKMHTIQLVSLGYENFKGAKKFKFDPDGKNASLVGANGTGKTTAFDAFLYLLFGKDSTGRTDFECRPLDDKNQPVKGLVVSVQATLKIDGVTHVFKKEEKEKIVKKEFKGCETFCWIDEVPKLVSEYSAYIKGILPEDTFKMLTDTHYFCEKFHWTSRRETLVKMAGEISEPKGFDALLAQLNGRTVEQLRKVFLERKKGYELERDGIGPRIDEIQKGLKDYAGKSTALKDQRNVLLGEIQRFDDERDVLLSKEQSRQKKIETLNALNKQKSEREISIATDPKLLEGFRKEQGQLQTDLGKSRKAVDNASLDCQKKVNEIASSKLTLQGYLTSLESIRIEFTNASKTDLIDNLGKSGQEEIGKIRAVVDDTKCFNPLCGKPYDVSVTSKAKQARESKIKELENSYQSQITELKNKQVAVLADIRQRGNDTKAKSVGQKNAIEKLESEANILTDKLRAFEADHKILDDRVSKRLLEIDKAVNGREKPDFAADALWNKTVGLITKAEKEIGESVSGQLVVIEDNRKAKSEEVEKLNQSLAQADRSEQDKKRIGELTEQEKDLSQKITEIDGQLASIAGYNASVSELVEAAVNHKFKRVTFKLFDRNLDGTPVPTCEAMLDGVPYSDLSYGQRIVVGVDIINVLSAHYGYSVVLFVDNSESLTYALEAQSQTICLRADRKQKTLKVEIEEKVA